MWQRNKGLKFGGFGAEIYFPDLNENESCFVYMEFWAQWLE